MEVTDALVKAGIDESVILRMEERYRSLTTEKHAQNGAAGCRTEENGHGQKELNIFEQHMQNYREHIALRKEKEGKGCLLFYAIKGETYKVK